LYCAADLFYASYIVNTTSWIDRAYIYINQLQSNREAVNQYYATRKFDLPDDFYNVVKDFSLLNSPQVMYVHQTAQYVYQWQMRNLQSILSEALGTDRGILFDLMQVNGLFNNIKDFILVEEAQIAQLPSDYQALVRNKNNELRQLIEANTNKTGFTENDIEKVADKDVFPFILSKFKGKPILLDIWATWCGPCLTANEEMKPVKKELADKDIVYVFVAGENSPLETWKNMIPDLPGEHFRLTETQWNYIGRTFGIEGVPTYFFIDREGNIKAKQIGYPGAQRMKEYLLQLL
jgi:thiol-disulfide isomerase/thioredoxin